MRVRVWIAAAVVGVLFGSFPPLVESTFNAGTLGSFIIMASLPGLLVSAALAGNPQAFSLKVAAVSNFVIFSGAFFFVFWLIDRAKNRQLPGSHSRN